MIGIRNGLYTAKMNQLNEEDRAARFLRAKFGKDFSDDDMAELLAEYRVWEEPDEMDGFSMETVERYIEEHRLNSKSRRRDIAYARFYLYAYIRFNVGMSYSDIGEMFSWVNNHTEESTPKDHASVLYGIRQHNSWIEDKDEMYLEVCKDLFFKFPFKNSKSRMYLIFNKNMILNLNYKDIGIIRRFRIESDSENNHIAVLKMIRRYESME